VVVLAARADVKARLHLFDRRHRATAGTLAEKAFAYRALFSVGGLRRGAFGERHGAKRKV
jgi:hypothetical protein